MGRYAGYTVLDLQKDWIVCGSLTGGLRNREICHQRLQRQILFYGFAATDDSSKSLVWRFAATSCSGKSFPRDLPPQLTAANLWFGDLPPRAVAANIKAISLPRRLVAEKKTAP